jgi:hypothetical protein
VTSPLSVSLSLPPPPLSLSLPPFLPTSPSSLPPPPLSLCVSRPPSLSLSLSCSLSFSLSLPLSPSLHLSFTHSFLLSLSLSLFPIHPHSLFHCPQPPPSLFLSLCVQPQAPKSLQRIIYVSCGFKALEVDTAVLLQGGWKLLHAEGHVFFPGSDHLESLAIFDRVA